MQNLIERTGKLLNTEPTLEQARAAINDLEAALAEIRPQQLATAPGGEVFKAASISGDPKKIENCRQDHAEARHLVATIEAQRNALQALIPKIAELEARQKLPAIKKQIMAAMTEHRKAAEIAARAAAELKKLDEQFITLRQAAGNGSDLPAYDLQTFEYLQTQIYKTSTDNPRARVNRGLPSHRRPADLYTLPHNVVMDKNSMANAQQRAWREENEAV